MIKIPSVKEVLLKSANLIEECGLHKGTYVNSTGKMCTTAALQIALGLRRKDGSMIRAMSYRHKFFERQSEVFQQLASVIIKKSNNTFIFKDRPFQRQAFIEDWNDTPELTQEEVLETLNLASIGAASNDTTTSA